MYVMFKIFKNRVLFRVIYEYSYENRKTYTYIQSLQIFTFLSRFPYNIKLITKEIFNITTQKKLLQTYSYKKFAAKNNFLYVLK